MRWRGIIAGVMLAVLAAVGALVFWGAQPVTVEYRYPEVVAEPVGRTAAFEVRPDGAGLRQQDVREMEFAFGRGAARYNEAPGEMLVLGGRAYLQGVNGALQTAEVLVNTEYALGVGPETGAPEMLHLPQGSPVPLEEVLNRIAEAVDGPVAVTGLGTFEEVRTEPGTGPGKNRFSAWWAERRGQPRPSAGLLVVAFYPGPGADSGRGDLWQMRGMITERTPAPGPAATPGELHARFREAGPRRMTPVAAGSTAVELNLAVYRLAEIVPATGFIEPPLVEIGTVDPTIVLDIRYAGTNNFLGYPVYPAARAYLVLPEAQRLARVNARLRTRGFALKVFDAYRPLSAHARLWELAPDKRFWADPERGSRHSRGAAVDCTLVTLDGRDVEMPTDFDDFTHRAHRDYQGASEAARRHRAILEEAMAAEGFIPLAKEWWHFDSPVWSEYPLLDIPLT